MLKKALLLIVVLYLPTISFSQWLEWQDITSTNLQVTSVANSDDEEKDFEVGDLNNDGYTDVIVVRKEPFSNSTEPAKSDLLLMNVNGVLIDQTNQFAPEFISNPTFARDIFIGDFDSDGWQDVIVANTFNQNPMYYRNRGNDNNGNWLGLIDESATRFPTTLDDVPLICGVWGGDLTGDGAMDIYFTNYKQNATGGIAKDFLFVNDGNGFFTNESETRLGDLRNSAFGTTAEIHDIDNDGDNDVIKVTTLYNVAPWNSRGVIVMYNNGNGTFTNWQNISQPVSASPYMIKVADFNLDGSLDVYVVDDGTDYLLTSNTITPNNNIVFTSQLINSPNVSGFGGNIHAADFDLDGDLDLGVADVDVDIPPCNSGRRFALLENVNGVMQDSYGATAVDWGVNTYDFGILDINNDGLQDFILGKCEGYSVFLSDNCDLVNTASDFDLDGIPDACDDCPNNPDPNCVEPVDFPIISTDFNIARQWNEMLLESIRRDFARPTVHARNLFHLSIAMWDAWSAYDNNSCTFLLGKTVDGFTCNFNGISTPNDLNAARDQAISFAAYRLLSHRFANSPQSDILQDGYDNHMLTLGYNINFTTTDYVGSTPAALGNYIAQCLIDFGLQDGSNEQGLYENQFYQPSNPPLIVDNPGNPTIQDYNAWQPLTLDLFIDQSGNPIPGATPDFLSPEWGQVTPFALSQNDLTVNQRDGFNYNVYHDPGMPPQLELNGGGLSDEYKWGYAMVAIWSSHLDPTDEVMWNISPNAIGNSNPFPTNWNQYANFYNQIDGGTQSSGHVINPSTGQPYANNMAPRGDLGRVLAEYWADGPDSETPPGHWFGILNEVSDHPALQKRIQGEGNIVDDLEWDVKAYFTMGGAMHDAAVTAWGLKGWYDYARPISAIRGMADLGQSSNPNALSYNPAGIPLVANYIELVLNGDSLAGTSNENVGKIKLKAWRGHDVINNVDTDEAGVDWILAENWVPYQRPSFVTPPFAGFVSGHSTFSRAAAEVMTNFTGDAYFPGGVGTFLAKQNEFLVFEDGPSVDIELQWATYRDAADQSALSRIWGGIHPPADDIPGRIIGEQVGIDAFEKAMSFFSDDDGDGIPNGCEDCADGDADNDGVCNNEDCQPNNANFPATPGIACNDNNANTENDVVTANGCGCQGTPIQTGGCNVVATSDGCTITITGISTSAVNNIKIFNPGWNGTAWSCNPWEGNPCSSTEVISGLANGIYPISISTSVNGQAVCSESYSLVINCTGGGPCDNLGGDSDNDGVCNDEDCQPNNANFPATAGSACDDNNANTENDVVTANGCGCQGTPIQTGGCNVLATSDGCTIMITGISTSAVNNIKIFNPGWNGTAWSCNPWEGNPCSSTEVISGLENGTYPISISTSVNGQAVCSESYSLVINCTGGGPCANLGGDSDNDGVCNNDDCQPNNANFPAPAGSACNDNNPNTGNDVVTANGCGCQGTPIQGPCANLGGDTDNDGVCNDNDCQPNNANFPATPGSVCNDNNPNTENDVVTANGCGCSGTPIQTGGCNVVATSDGCTITIVGITGATTNLKLFNPGYDGVAWSCNPWEGNPCNGTEVISGLANGVYPLSVYTVNANGEEICNFGQSITINCTGGGPCDNLGGDSDGDGICNNNDNCPNISNPAQTDSNNNGIGDACDTNTGTGCTSTSNLALNKTATQSSTISAAGITASASKAVDGNTNGTFFTSPASASSVSATTFESEAWWQVDLGAQYDIEQVKIFNRTDGVDKTKSCYIMISDTPFTGNNLSVSQSQADAEVYESNAPNSPSTYNFNVTGRYVRVQHDVAGYLVMGEVQVLGCTPNQTLSVPDDLDFTVEKNNTKTQKVELEEIDKVTIYPNPTSEIVNVVLRDFAGKKGTVRIYNSFGHQMMERGYSSIPLKDMQLDVSEYQNGIYFLSIEVEGYRQITKKLVMSR